nr:U1 small nuclear ribonucleoprotein C-like [Penaeus vannamei]
MSVKCGTRAAFSFPDSDKAKTDASTPHHLNDSGITQAAPGGERHHVISGESPRIPSLDYFPIGAHPPAPPLWGISLSGASRRPPSLGYFPIGGKPLDPFLGLFPYRGQAPRPPFPGVFPYREQAGGAKPPTPFPGGISLPRVSPRTPFPRGISPYFSKSSQYCLHLRRFEVTRYRYGIRVAYQDSAMYECDSK